MTLRWSEQDGIRWLETGLPGGGCAFTTRGGGVSEPPFDRLNLGPAMGDPGAMQNRARLAAALGIEPGRISVARQVHGARVLRHDRPGESNGFMRPGRSTPEADGHVTGLDGHAAMVLVADCLPVALAGQGGVGIVHCGWRGLAAGIVERGVEAISATHAVVGPGIGPCCYEVGDEVLEAFEPLGPDVARGRMLDLRAVATALLERAGVAEVEVSEICTSCTPELFFSFRRDGERTGRQAGLVWAGNPPG